MWPLPHTSRPFIRSTSEPVEQAAPSTDVENAASRRGNPGLRSRAGERTQTHSRGRARSSSPTSVCLPRHGNVPSVKVEIQRRFEGNLARVNSLVELYDAQVPGQGRAAVSRTDLLRAAVVFLHASLEDLLRSALDWKLPDAAPEHLAAVPLLNCTKGGDREPWCDLSDLALHRGKTVDLLLSESVSARELELQPSRASRRRSSPARRCGIPAGPIPEHARADDVTAALDRAPRRPEPDAWIGAVRGPLALLPDREEMARCGRGLRRRVSRGALERTHAMTKDALEQRLREFPDVVEVEVAGNGRLVAKVTAQRWVDVDDGDRQEAVWAFLRSHFSEADLQAVEYIITNAPGDPPEA